MDSTNHTQDRDMDDDMEQRDSPKKQHSQDQYEPLDSPNIDTITSNEEAQRKSAKIDLEEDPYEVADNRF